MSEGDVILTAQEFRNLVLMRSAQKRFFGTFGPGNEAEHRGALIDSKTFETRVDALIVRHVRKNLEPDLFEQQAAENSEESNEPAQP